MNVSIQPVSPYEQYEIKALPQKGDAVLLMAQELAEFKRLNELAKENKRVQSTLILWNGIEESRPSAEKIPVISLEQIEKSSKKQLDWQDLCLMADHPERDEEKPTLWKYVAAMF